MLKRRFVLALLSQCISIAVAQDRSAQLDAYLQGLTDAGKFQGSVLLAQQGQTVLRKGYGLANAEFDIPNTPSIKFRLASITKQFTAMAVLQLQSRGKLNTDDRICQYLPICPDSWTAITIHQLLTHTSGIPDYLGFSGIQATALRPALPDEVIGYFSGKPLDFPPGQGFNYSNSGYIVLGRLVELVSGQPYEDFLRDNIFNPIGMSASGFDRFTRVLKSRAAGYLFKDNKVDSIAPYLDMSWAYSAGGLYSTVDDLYLWTQALDRGDLIPAPLLARMFTPNAYGYGYGWVIGQLGGHSLTFHDGEINGFLTWIARFPDDKATMIVLSNQESTDITAVIQVLAAALLQGG